MYCVNCNKNFSEEHHFCDTCGSRLVNGNAPSQPQSPEPSYQQSPSPSYYYEPSPVYQDPPYYAPVTLPQAAPAAQHEQIVSVGAWFGIAFLNVVPFGLSLLYIFMLIKSSIENFDYINWLTGVFIGLTLVYVILLFVWAFGKPKKQSLKNYSIATIVMTLLLVVVYLIFRDNIIEYLGFDFFDLFYVY